MYPLYPPAALRSHIETLLGLYVDMTQRGMETLQSLSALHLQLGRDLIAEAGANTQRLMASKDAGQLAAAVVTQFTPGGPAMQNYQRQLTDILSRTIASLTQTAADYMPGMSRSVNTMAQDWMHEATERTARAAEQLARFQPGSQLRH